MADDVLAFPDEPKTELDQRIVRLVAAAHALQRDEDGLRALVAANQSIAAVLDLDRALATIVESTVLLSGAASGTVVVRGDDGNAPRTVHATGAPARSTTSPAQVLTVPIRVGGVVQADLVLTGHDFSGEAVRLVESVAISAGSAIEHARLLEDARLGRRWAAASAELTAQLLADRTDDPLGAMADRLLDLADAGPGYIAFLSAVPETVAVHGLETHRRGLPPDVMRAADTFAAQVSGSASPIRLTADGAAAMSATAPDLDAHGPVLGIPIIGGAGPLGALVLCRPPGAPGFSRADAAMAGDFVAQVSVAMRLRRALHDSAPAAIRDG